MVSRPSGNMCIQPATMPSNFDGTSPGAGHVRTNNQILSPWLLTALRKKVWRSETEHSKFNNCYPAVRLRPWIARALPRWLFDPNARRHPRRRRAQGTHDEDASPGPRGCRRVLMVVNPTTRAADLLSADRPDRGGRRSLHRRGLRKEGDQARHGGRRCDPGPPVDARPGRADSHGGRVARPTSNRPTRTSGPGWSTA